MTRLLTVTTITSLPNKCAVHIQFKDFSTLRFPGKERGQLIEIRNIVLKTDALLSVDTFSSFTREVKVFRHHQKNTILRSPRHIITTLLIHFKEVPGTL